MIKEPTIEIIAGSNGVGKSTISDLFIEERTKFIYLNPDIIGKGLDASNKTGIAINSGRIVLEEIKNSLYNNKSFAFETTLSDKIWIKLLTEAKKRGYQIIIYYIVVDNIQIALDRIQTRVSQGGHFIPDQVVKRRFKRSFDLFRNTYSQMADYWFLVDNTEQEAKVIAKKENNDRIILDKEKFKNLFKEC